MVRSALLLTVARFLLSGLSACSDHDSDLDAARRQQAKRPDGGAGEVAPETAVGSTTQPPGAQPVTPPPAGACAPQPVQQIQAPVWRRPNQLHAQQCTAQEAQALVACYIGQQQAACDSQVTLPCHRCIISDPAIDQSFGPIIFNAQRPQDVELNVEGCVAALAGDVGPTGCGPKLQAANACKRQACAACEQQGGTGLQQCLQAASTGVCAQFENQARACAGNFLAQCQPPNANALQLGLSLAQAFCM